MTEPYQASVPGRSTPPEVARLRPAEPGGSSAVAAGTRRVTEDPTPTVDLGPAATADLGPAVPSAARGTSQAAPAGAATAAAPGSSPAATPGPAEGDARAATEEPASGTSREPRTQSLAYQLSPARLSVTSRVMLALSAIAALGLVLATAVFWWSEDQVREQRVDANLAQEVEELRTMAGDLDPATGQPFASVSALMSTFLTRNLPSQHEGFLVLIDGQVPFLPPWDDRLPLEDVPELIEAGRAVTPDGSPTYGDVTTAENHLRYAAVPVTVPGDPSHGVFVVASDLTAEADESNLAHTAQIFILIGTVLLIALVATLVVSRLLRPLATLAATADRISEEDLSERIPETGADDLARLTRTVNGMLDRLEVAFDGQRALLDDVGHELRTPLTVIRGHLELVDANDPQDVRETADLVLDETDRMSRLVEELVLLAKSMRPDFLTLHDVDIDTLVEGFYERAKALGERRWKIDSLSGGAVVTGDAQRLLQAGLQLAANAVRHTEEDDEIGIGTAIDGDVVRVWVRDTGAGIPSAEQQRIFERAVRGTGGRGAGAPADTFSSGLGLSIVSAIAEAHGGRISLSSAPGAGSTFGIGLPHQAFPGTDEEKPS